MIKAYGIFTDEMNNMQSMDDEFGVALRELANYAYYNINNKIMLIEIFECENKLF